MPMAILDFNFSSSHDSNHGTMDSSGKYDELALLRVNFYLLDESLLSLLLLHPLQ